MAFVVLCFGLLLFFDTASAFATTMEGTKLNSLHLCRENVCMSTRARQCRRLNVLTNLRMDDEMARKGIKVDMTVHSEEELDAWREAGGRLSESWHDLSPLSQVHIQNSILDLYFHAYKAQHYT